MSNKQPFIVPRDAGIVRGDKGRFQTTNPKTEPKVAPPPVMPPPTNPPTERQTPFKVG